MNNISDLTEQIENLEPDVESAVEKKQEITEKEEALEAALNDLEHDLAIMSIAQKHLDITQNDYNRIEATLADYREQVTEIQNELTELTELTNRSTGVIEDLGKLGIIPDASVSILEERKKMIEKCNEQLQEVSRLLDLNYYFHMVKSVSVADYEKKPESELKENTSLNDSSKKQEESQLAEYSSWNGVLFHGNISSEYADILESRFSEATPLAQKVFYKYHSSLIVRDTGFMDTPHYMPYSFDNEERGVYLNSLEDEYNERGRGTTFYHEMGHMIDHAANHFQSFMSENNVDFYLALKADGAKITEWFKGLDGATKGDFIMYLEEGKCNSLSDLLGPLSEGIIIGGFGHEDDYWKRSGSLEKEAFAHFFEASMGYDHFQSEPKKEILKGFFPQAWNEFEKMLNQISMN